MQNSISSVRDFFQHYQEAAFEKDVPAMISLYDDKVMVFDLWNKGFVAGIEAWSSVITGWLKSLKDENVRVEFEQIDIYEDAKVGFANAIIQFQVLNANDVMQQSMKNRISLGFIKKEGDWKVKHQHTSAPVDFSLKAILNI